MDKKGGRVSVTINGRTFTARSSVSISPATVERSNGVNRDGSGYSTIAPKLASAEISFDRGERSGIVFDDAMLLADVNCTIWEEDAQITHFFTNAGFGGTPSIDTESGEVSGMRVEAPRNSYSFRAE
ncbi:MAG: phage tail tube protein [Bosea sp.]|jgi:hypothetical protein|uniref:phage tail tube protein n=1 Tax=Bosea sp. (in: a-proteobacteria) TaxID=1871050 RepID=UPI001ACF612A|nr:phage tail tube protein [Bosea sp. (in: a-proteobacteria)]MBN9453256.1 phage tail tube protein [Bosea sp. (in: a-proteobacteria)]